MHTPAERHDSNIIQLKDCKEKKFRRLRNWRRGNWLSRGEKTNIKIRADTKTIFAIGPILVSLSHFDYGKIDYKISAHLFVAFEDRTFECVGAAISCNIAKYFEIAAVVWNIKYSINWVLHEFDVIGVVGPLFFLNRKMRRKWKWKYVESAEYAMKTYENQMLTFRFFFFSETFTPSTEIWIATLRFFRFWTLHSYWNRKETENIIRFFMNFEGD